MPENLTINLDGSHSFSGDSVKIDIDDYASNIWGSQIITFTDGGAFTAVAPSSYSGTVRLELAKMGNHDGVVDEFHFDLSTFNEDFDLSIKSEGPEDSFVISGYTSYSVSGGVYRIVFTGADGNTHEVNLDPDTASVVFMCFVPGTLIDTPSGPVAVEDLGAGDLVETRDNGPRPIGHVLLRDAQFGQSADAHKPVLISAGSLGVGLPEQDLVVSPHHRVLLSGSGVLELFDTPEVLAPAKGLLKLPGIRQKKGVKRAEYIALLLDHHEIVSASGLPCETLLLAPYTVATLPQEHRQKIDAKLPLLMRGHSTPARPLITVAQARFWAERCIKAAQARHLECARRPSLGTLS